MQCVKYYCVKPWIKFLVAVWVLVTFLNRKTPLVCSHLWSVI